jgi:hypothetical protein
MLRGWTIARPQRNRETELPETAASITIVVVGYRVRCTERGCQNLGRLLLRFTDAGGGPITNAEFCHAHARVKIAHDRAAGLKVFDDHPSSQALA